MYNNIFFNITLVELVEIFFLNIITNYSNITKYVLLYKCRKPKIKPIPYPNHMGSVLIVCLYIIN